MSTLREDLISSGIPESALPTKDEIDKALDATKDNDMSEPIDLLTFAKTDIFPIVADQQKRESMIGDVFKHSPIPILDEDGKQIIRERREWMAAVSAVALSAVILGFN